MKQRIVALIITIVMMFSCSAFVYADEWGDIIENPWGNLFQEDTVKPGDLPFGAEAITTKTKKTVVKENTPGKAVIKKVYPKKYKAKKLKISVKKVNNAIWYQVAVFKTKKNAVKTKKYICAKTFRKTKFTIKSKKLKNKKKLYVKVRAFNRTKVGKWSKIIKVKIKK